MSEASLYPPSTLNPPRNPPSKVLISIQLRTSISWINNEGDIGYPCLNPLKLSKKPVGDRGTIHKDRKSNSENTKKLSTSFISHKVIIASNPNSHQV
jgi:hypothetical protein